MFGSAIVYSGLIVASAGLVLVVKPIRRFRITTRRRGAGVAGAGVLLAAIGLILPASESRVTRMESRLDELMPAWQFRERHTIAIAAPPARVFEAIERTRADEIFLFRTLILIRNGGRPPFPQSVLKAAQRESLIDFATHTTFVRLARDVPRELVVGTVVGAPPGTRGRLTPQVFQQRLPDGFALATMNFIVMEAGPGRSRVSTETRVFANSPSARRRFAAYWRVIYPGSALIRRMWLRAIERRATRPNESLPAMTAAAIAGGAVEQTSHGSRPALTLLESFDGLGAGMAAGPGTNNPPAPRNPSDNSLAVGPNHIFQIVNAQLAIFTKKGARYDASGQTLYGPVSTNTIFAGFGGVCEARPNGDAVVRYDQLAGRWLVVMPIFRRTVFDPDRSAPGQPAKPGEAARPGAPGRPGPPPPLPPARPGQELPQPGDGTYAMCYAVSVGEDPLGPYYRYAFERPLFPDYPRPAIWPDGYYVPTSTGDDVIQKHACVVERANMLRGQPAREQCIVIDGVNFLNNADIDGRGLPPAGAPNIMMAAGGAQLQKILGDDGIVVWKFHVDWKNPARTKVIGPEKIAVAPYRYLCGGQLTNCVTQPGTDRRLDAQGDKIMQRLVYRNAGGHESIVAVHSVDTEAAGGGVRWYEFRIDQHRDVHLHQQGTYAPDRFYRWMASPAMDRQGNIAIGYSFGGAPNYPGQRLAARLATDPPGVLTFRETVLVEGEASQTVMRWEDYTQTAMDPVDDCTIWYVGDYVKTITPTYSTRIGSVRLPGCG